MQALNGTDIAIGAAVTALARVAMTFDHLLGDDPGLEDPVAFAVSAVLVLATAALVFGLVIPRAHSSRSVAAKRALILSLLSFLAIALIWLGVTFVLAGGAVALGLYGRASERRWLAWAAIAIGVFVLSLSTTFSDWTSSS